VRSVLDQSRNEEAVHSAAVTPHAWQGTQESIRSQRFRQIRNFGSGERVMAQNACSYG
jgi:hypothetical protein